jgi:hypothetical protein
VSRRDRLLDRLLLLLSVLLSLLASVAALLFLVLLCVARGGPLLPGLPRRQLPLPGLALGLMSRLEFLRRHILRTVLALLAPPLEMSRGTATPGVMVLFECRKTRAAFRPHHLPIHFWEAPWEAP